jgi:hypothetical protein
MPQWLQNFSPLGFSESVPMQEWNAMLLWDETSRERHDLQLEVIETFQNEDGSRVVSRWRITGKNNGILGTPADQQPISFTGTAI